MDMENNAATANEGPFRGSRYLASGLLVEVNADTRRAAPVTCDAWVTNAGDECGARIRRHPDYPTRSDATLCDNGHDRLPIEIELAPGGPAWQRELAERLAC